MRRRRRGQALVSLFPFLSVLACIIGTLTLVVAALALQQVASDLETGVRVAGAEAQHAAVTLATLRSETGALGEQFAELRRTRVRIAVLRDALSRNGLSEQAMMADITSSLEQRRLAEEAARALPALRARLAEADAALAAGNTRLEQLRADSAKPTGRITLQPTGYGEALVPHFVECRRDGLLLHAHDKGWSAPIQIDDPADAARFTRFLSRAREIRDVSIIFLIRPDGIASYRHAVRRVDDARLRHGKLALPTDGEIDFSLL